MQQLTCGNRAIENGANALAEGFLFAVAAALILGETWRSSRSQSKRRDDVDDQLQDLSSRVGELQSRVDAFASGYDDRWEEEKQRRVIDHIQTAVGLNYFLQE